MAHQNEPVGNKGVTLNGRALTPEQVRLLRDALGITDGLKDVAAGTTVDLPYGTPSRVEDELVGDTMFLNFFLQAGKPGIDGVGSVEAVEAIGVAFGQAPNVEDIGTPGHTRLRFTIPAGPPGTGLPANPQEDYVVGYKNGAALWVPQSAGGGEGGTVINNNYNVDTIAGPYPWEGGGVIVPVQTVFDAVTYAAYQSAMATAPVGGKRAAGAASLIASFGVVQKLTLKRNGVSILVANYLGPMTQTTIGSDIAVVLSNLDTVSAISTGDNLTGTWSMEISGGAGFTRTMTLPTVPDAATAAGQGFNPGPITLILPISQGA